MSGYIAPWRRQLQAASFRGVPFFVKNATTQVGRRVEIHEYPQRDEAYPEDLGQKADAFTIEAVVIGPDYFKARDALIAALKKAGPGALVHPYYGQRTVTLASPARISESPEEGGLARFSLDFVEAGENVEPSARQDTQGAVDSAADQASEAAADEFASDFSVDGVPDYVFDSAIANANSAVSALEAARRKLVPNTAKLTDFLYASTRLAGSFNTLLRSPAAFAQTVLGVLGALKALARSPLVALGSYRGMFNYGSSQPTVPKTTASRLRQGNNQAAMATLIRRGAMIEAARSASQADYDTYDQAVAMRDELAALLDDEAAGIVPAPTGNGSPATTVREVSEPVYQALTALRVALVRDLSTRAIDAPRVTRATLPSTMPALVAAYRIHGDATREAEILSRNGRLIRHPGFVPGGEALEIISR